MYVEGRKYPTLIERKGTQVTIRFDVRDFERESTKFYAWREITSEVDRDSIITKLIRDQYPLDRELAICNNVRRANPEAKHLNEDAEFQAYRDACKGLADDVVAALKEM